MDFFDKGHGHDNDNDDLERRLTKIENTCLQNQAELDLVLENEHLTQALAQRIIGLILQAHSPTGMTITQLNSRTRSTNAMSTPAGGTSNFQMAYTPAGSVPPVGTTQAWTVDDTADITLAPSADGTTCTATCVATPTGTSYNLTCTSSYTAVGATAPLSTTVNVTIVPSTGGNLPTGISITQLS
jgi:hypothetical protein